VASTSGADHALGDDAAVLLDEPDQLGDLGGLAGAVEQHPQPGAVKRRGRALGEIVAVDEHDVRAEPTNLLRRSLAANDRQRLDPGSRGQRDEVVADGRVGEVEGDPDATVRPSRQRRTAMPWPR
jgi:hypothetical protein